MQALNTAADSQSGADHVRSDPDELRRGCAGLPPLDGRIEPWMGRVCRDLRLYEWVEEYDSPINIVCEAPFQRRVQTLCEVAANRRVDLAVFFARKANKCLAFVDACRVLDCGVDVASETELVQTLDCGVRPEQIVCTAAVKNRSLVQFCVANQICLTVDNSDELALIEATARALGNTAAIAPRLSGFSHQGEKLRSRFGYDVDRFLSDFPQQQTGKSDSPCWRVDGVHFHLDGYCSQQRVSALQQSLETVEHLRSRGFRPTFIDMGGGMPMSYLVDAEQWQAFWQTHEAALLGRRSPVTFGNHGLGLLAVDGSLHGVPNVYPHCQHPVQEEWLAAILDAELDGRSIAAALRESNLQLRCEPGRSLLDGSGMTVARVEFRKQGSDGEWLIGLSMNRTQCCAGADDCLVDPLLIPQKGTTRDDPAGNRAIEGFLVGAYCTEAELLSLRRFRFPRGVAVGDLVAFPNTAGYLMHFLESRSHQMPLAKNLVFQVDEDGSPQLDRLDRLTSPTTTAS